MTHIERRVVDSFWDLRDDAHDHPDRWQAVSAELLFQHLAEYAEEVETLGAPMNWAAVADRMIAWRTNER